MTDTDDTAVRRVTPSALDLIVRCADEHRSGCPCRYGGEVELPELVIEDHGGYVVVADRGD